MQTQVFLVALVLSGAALTAGFRHAPESETFTDPAGEKAGDAVDLLTAPEFYGIRALKLWDFDNRACQLQIEQGSLNAAGSSVLDAVKLCEPRLTQAWKRADLGAGRFVTAIAVCTARKPGPQPVRGVEIWGASIGPGAKLAPSKPSVRVQFPGCERWSPRRACPAGSIATGIRAFSVGDDGAVGLALRCHRVESMP